MDSQYRFLSKLNHAYLSLTVPNRKTQYRYLSKYTMDEKENIFIFVLEKIVVDENYSSTSDMSNSEPDTDR